MSTHKYLDTTGLGQVWGKIKDLIPESDIFAVTITSTGSGSNAVYSADKTFSEITAAYNSGKECIALKGNEIYQLTNINNTRICFVSMNIVSSNNTGTAEQLTSYLFNGVTGEITRESSVIYGISKNNNTFINKESIAKINTTTTDGGAVTNLNAIQNYNKGDLFWYNSTHIVRAITDINSGDALIENTNYVRTTIADELKDLASLPLIGNVFIDGTTATFSGLSANEIFQAWGNDIPVYFKEMTGEGGNEYRKYTLTHCWGGNYITMEFYSIYGDSYYNTYSLISIQASVSRNDDTLTTFTGTVTYTTISGTQSDWGESDSTDPAYILNKPSIKAGEGENSIVEGSIGTDEFVKYVLNITGEANAVTFTYTSEITIPDSVDPIWCVAEYENQSGSFSYYAVKNIDITNSIITLHKKISSSAISNGILNIYFKKSLAIGQNSHTEGNYSASTNSGAHSEGLRTRALSNGAHSEGCGTIASGIYSHSEGSGTEALGVYSHVEGYKNTVDTTGQGAHAEGGGNIASANYSHAEGFLNEASGVHAHVEGSVNSATGQYSHAEGGTLTWTIPLNGDANSVIYTLIEGQRPLVYEKNRVIGGRVSKTSTITISSPRIIDATISDGWLTSITVDKTLDASTAISGNCMLALGTVAYGSGSHSEGGNTYAKGTYSHAEGRMTSALSTSSHAEGYYTIANGNYQHVQGQFNIQDTNGTYAHIVGNGTSSARSNAHTLDWSGNGWYAGKLTVGINPVNDMDVTTKQYVDNAISTISCATISEIEEMCDALGFLSVTIDTSDYVDADE